MKKIHIIGGGTFAHVRNHLALAAPAFGGTARRLADLFYETATALEYSVWTHLTKMADPASKLVTNDDVSKLIGQLIADPDTRVIILNAALCDYNGYVEGSYELPTVSGKYETRLKTAEGVQKMLLYPAEKLIGKIRKDRKDIFVVGFKTTTGATADTQYSTALKFLKSNSINLVVANDTVTRNNMIVAPEETRYCETTDRSELEKNLVGVVLARMQNTFTRSTVAPGESVPWSSELVPDNLRQVVDWCISQGAYKTVNGVTAGHFAVKIDDHTILTSKRKRNFNELAEIGLVKVEYQGDDHVVAYGHKPSVGGQSQRVVFREHPELDCIVHFHCPPRDPNTWSWLSRPQWPYECGSHQCGANTSSGLVEMPGFGGKLKAVMLEGHGPNIVFSRDLAAPLIIEFIERNFDLKAKTGGLVAA